MCVKTGFCFRRATLIEVAKLTPQYSSSLKICGGSGDRGFGSLTVPPFDVALFCMKSLSVSFPGSVISMTSYFTLFESSIISTRCCRFFTCNYLNSRNQNQSLHESMKIRRESTRSSKEFLFLPLTSLFPEIPLIYTLTTIIVLMLFVRFNVKRNPKRKLFEKNRLGHQFSICCNNNYLSDRATVSFPGPASDANLFYTYW